MAYEYPIGTRIMYRGSVKYEDCRDGSWTVGCDMCGKIVAIHPENKKRYEVLPDDSRYGQTVRVSPKAIIGNFSGWSND